MPEITLRHEFDCDEDTYWNKCLFDLEFNTKLYLETLKFPHYEVVVDDDTAERRVRKVRIEPQVGSLPGPVKKMVGDKLAYLEEGTFDKNTKRYNFTITPSILPEKTKTGGQLYCETLGEKRIARIATIKVEVKVFAIGGMVEDKIIGDLKASYDAAAKFTNEWVKTRGL